MILVNIILGMSIGLLILYSLGGIYREFVEMIIEIFKK